MRTGSYGSDPPERLLEALLSPLGQAERMARTTEAAESGARESDVNESNATTANGAESSAPAANSTEPNAPEANVAEPVVEYVGDVRVVDVTADGAPERYRFEAPHHCGIEFEDCEAATLYADVYFEVNGFREEGSGELGIPPEIVQSGKDTMAAYLLALPATTDEWVASFYGTTPGELDKYVSWVRNRAEKIRERAREEGVE